jgi:DNA-binding MarR family transcriptional regulator
VTRLLDGLERCGLVEKATCPSDLRVTYAALTDAGRKRLEEASCDHLAAVQAFFEERFSEAELATLAELLARLPGAAPAADDDCRPGPKPAAAA